MQRLRTPALRGAALGLLGLLATSCSPSVDRLPETRSARGSLGEEVYKVLCRRMAGVELPADASGVSSERVCLGSPSEVQSALSSQAELPARLVTLARARAELVRAIDDVFPDDEADALELLMRELLPFYDAPEERMQSSTRALADVLRAVAQDDDALAGLESLGRAGMTSAEGAYGLVRALFSNPALHELLDDVAPHLTGSGEAARGFETLLTGLALELATSEHDAGPDSDLRRLRRLLQRHVDGPGAPWLVAVRDTRGLPVPMPDGAERVPFPFVDADADGLADVQNGQFTLKGDFSTELPAPFAVPGEAGVARDKYGRALAFAEDGASDPGRTLFVTHDANDTLLAALLPQAGKLFAADTAIATNLAQVVPALFGARVQTEQAYGQGSFVFEGPDVTASPFVDLVHGATSLLADPSYDDGLDLGLRLLRSQEPVLVGALAPLLALERRTRGEDDAYPEAQLSEDTLLWDELLGQAERLSRRRRSAAGESSLAALMRAALGYARNPADPDAPLTRVIELERLRHQGAVLAALMRFKDDWRANPKGESKRAPDEDVVRGSFQSAVDRSLPDLPVTCGKDGCGGLLAGSPFEDWLRKTAQQKCLLGNEGRSGNDCGTATNQSLYQRSLGLVSEMAGRSQQNKRITVGDLLDFAVLVDPCANLAPATACEGSSQAARDAFCGARFGTGASTDDFACNTQQQCYVRRESDTCNALLTAQDRDRAESIALAEDAVADDYTCPAAEPEAACHGYEAQYPAAFMLVDGQPAAIQAGHLLDLPDVGRAFGRALTHEFVIDVPNPWVRRYLEDVARAADATLPACDPGDIDDPSALPHRNSDGAECVPDAARLSRDVYEDMPLEVDTLGELVEFLLDDSSLFQGDADTRALRPDVNALSRVLFAPPGSSSFIVFDPLLVQHAPAACSAAPSGTPACVPNQGPLDASGSCCLASLAKPPLRYRLDTYYGATTFAWEHAFRFADGTSLSFIDSMKAIADAVNRTDFQPEQGDDARDFEGTDFVFSTLGKLMAEHYDSAQNPLVQASDPQGMHYRKLSNLVSYESMVADALDDGTLDDPLVDQAAFPTHLGVLFHALPLLEALDRLGFSGGRDGIDVATNLSELWLNPHASCAGPDGDRRVLAGQGACHRFLAGEPGLLAPPAARDGRNVLCWVDGRCFDQPDDRRFLSPLYLVLDALRAVDDRIAEDAGQERALELGLGGMLDAYLANDGEALTDRRLHALVLSLLAYTRERWAEERDAGTLDSLGPDLTNDTVELLQNPVFAGALRMLEGLLAHKGALASGSRFAFGLLDAESKTGSVRALTTFADDALECLPGSPALNASLRAFSQALLPEARDVLAGKPAGSPRTGLVFQNLALLTDAARLDEAHVLDRVLANAARLGARTHTPLAQLAQVLTAIERRTPGKTGPLEREDYRALLNGIADVLSDDERGFERLFRIVQCRSGGPGCE